MANKIIIDGGTRLAGEIDLQGAKNSVLPILAATILGNSPSVIHNCPQLSDVDAAIEILENFGCSVKREGHAVWVDPTDMDKEEIPLDLMRKMRSSVIFLGAVLGKLGRAKLSYPGGCELGPRPIDLHIDGLRRLGAHIKEDYGFFHCEAPSLLGCSINLSIPSVGATENIMLAAVKSDGVTTIINAAKEPEIEDLQDFLNQMGGKITGAGTAVVTIEGVSSLTGAEHRVIPDRIVAATYLCFAAATGGEIVINQADIRHLQHILALLKGTGCEIRCLDDQILISQKGEVTPVKTIQTMPYPGFPTDAQAPVMAYLAKAEGTSVFVETIFENRFKHVGELCRMGADIRVIGRTAIVYGVPRLHGAQVQCGDLRGGAALLVAALSAEGQSEISEIHHIERGYEDVVENLSKLGAKIKRM
jgi:UDP-N-acetylglucosamine 1-carboxyvinyltransferase